MIRWVFQDDFPPHPAHSISPAQHELVLTQRTRYRDFVWGRAGILQLSDHMCQVEENQSTCLQLHIIILFGVFIQACSAQTRPSIWFAAGGCVLAHFLVWLSGRGWRGFPCRSQNPSHLCTSRHMLPATPQAEYAPCSSYRHSITHDFSQPKSTLPPSRDAMGNSRPFLQEQAEGKGRSSIWDFSQVKTSNSTSLTRMAEGMAPAAPPEPHSSTCSSHLIYPNR